MKQGKLAQKNCQVERENPKKETRAVNWRQRMEDTETFKYIQRFEVKRDSRKIMVKKWFKLRFMKANIC